MRFFPESPTGINGEVGSTGTPHSRPNGAMKTIPYHDEGRHPLQKMWFYEKLSQTGGFTRYGYHNDMKDYTMIWKLTIQWYEGPYEHTMTWRTIQWYEGLYNDMNHHTPYTIHHTHTTWDRFWQWRYFFSSSPSMFFFCLKSKHRQNFTSYWSNWLL